MIRLDHVEESSRFGKMSNSRRQPASYLIHNARLVTPFEEISAGWIRVDGGTITEIGQGSAPTGQTRPEEKLELIDAKSSVVIPGLIDTHVCGMLGHDCREGFKAFGFIAQGLARFGVSGFLPTLLSSATSESARLIDDARQAQGEYRRGAEILGVHIEGPYLGCKYRGLTLQEELAKPSISRDRVLYEKYPGFVKMVTLAPELPGGEEYVKYLKQQQVVVSIGHTEIGSLAELDTAIRAGASHVTHIFNAMRVRGLKELGVDSPGFADLAIIEDRLSVSLIADGVHVCPELIKLLARAKAHDKIILMTDCFMATGLPSGNYTYANGVEVFVDGTCHRAVKDKILAGSVLTLNRAVKNMLDWTDLAITEVLPMATYNPARLIGLQDRKGSLEGGKDADLAIMDEDWDAQLTMVGGRIVYRSGDEK